MTEDEKSNMQQHLEKHTTGEVLDYIEKVLTDERLNEYGGPEPFLDAVEKAEKQGENREQVLNHIKQRRE